MIDSLTPVSLAAAPCKICGAPAELYGVVDFHKCCEEINGFRLPLAGVPIYYRRCAACGFLFTDVFDGWDHDAFKRCIYNEGYGVVDPQYQSARPRSNAEVVARLWGALKAKTRVLDYGGGNDTFCATLRGSGFAAATTYDPMTPEFARPPDGKFDLVTCFETLEHLPDPLGGFAALVEHVAEPGLVLYSTYAQPADFNQYGMSWWYIAPRNGHISIFSRQALRLAWARHGYKTVSFNDNVHLAFRTLPPALAHLAEMAEKVPMPTGV